MRRHTTKAKLLPKRSRLNAGNELAVDGSSVRTGADSASGHQNGTIILKSRVVTLIVRMALKATRRGGGGVVPVHIGVGSPLRKRDDISSASYFVNRLHAREGKLCRRACKPRSRQKSSNIWIVASCRGASFRRITARTPCRATP
jgi:hypothetical protein